MNKHKESGASPLLAGVVSLMAVTLFMMAFLHAESQGAVAALLIGAVVVLAAMARFGFLRTAERSFETNQHLMNGLVVLGVLSVAAAFYDGHFALLMLATVLLYIVVCLGLNIQFGYVGVVNFAGAAFFGVGAYTAAVLAANTALPHLLIVLCAGVIAALVGCVLLFPVLRTRGHYAGIVTIAFSLLFKTFLEVNHLFGGPQGLKVPGIKILGWSFNDDIKIGGLEISFYMNYVLLSLVLVCVLFVLMRRLERSWIGLSLDAVRLDETSASAFGINVVRWKITAFILGNFLIGLAGAIYAMMTGFVAPNSFTFGDSLILVSILILGGIGNPWGILPAAAIVLMLPEKLQFIQEYRFLLFAALVIFILLYRPDGLLPRRLRNYIPGRAKR
jgi:ABC-type branched-subunit amino acid transport system permease subunit